MGLIWCVTYFQYKPGDYYPLSIYGDNNDMWYIYIILCHTMLWLFNDYNYHQYTSIIIIVSVQKLFHYIYIYIYTWHYIYIYILLAPYAPVAPSSPCAPSSLSPRHSVVDGLNKGILIHTSTSLNAHDAGITMKDMDYHGLIGLFQDEPRNSLSTRCENPIISGSFSLSLLYRLFFLEFLPFLTHFNHHLTLW